MTGIISAILLFAQWLTQPTVGIPRTPDGKPNLTAPAPRTADGKPDLSGLWRTKPNAYGGNVAADLKPADIQPWAVDLFNQRMENLGSDGPTVKCLPAGPLYVFGGFMTKIIQTPALAAILYEDLVFRQVFLDGRALPRDPNPSWTGYSVGRWEGDTLVVETIGFTERAWLDGGGHPHTEDLRVTERFHRKDFGHMDVRVTLEDPKIYAKPMTFSLEEELSADTELVEYVCAENNKDPIHLVGKASDDKKNAVKVSREILAAYVGSYEFTAPDDPKNKFLVNVTLPADELMVDFEGKDPMPITPTGEASFLGLGSKMEFVKDASGKFNTMLFQIVEGEMKGMRKQ